MTSKITMTPRQWQNLKETFAALVRQVNAHDALVKGLRKEIQALIQNAELRISMSGPFGTTGIPQGIPFPKSIPNYPDPKKWPEEWIPSWPEGDIPKEWTIFTEKSQAAQQLKDQFQNH